MALSRVSCSSLVLFNISSFNPKKKKKKKCNLSFLPWHQLLAGLAKNFPPLSIFLLVLLEKLFHVSNACYFSLTRE